MNIIPRLVFFSAFFISVQILFAQNYKAERLKKAVEVTCLQFSLDSLMPDTTFYLVTKDNRVVCLRTDAMGSIEHIGIPLFNDVMRFIQPSPVYDFLEYAVLNWKYKVNPNQLYLSKVIFKHGSWETLLKERLQECDCSIENRDDKLYIVTWKRKDREVVQIGIPIEYELLNNDTRRNMERAFINELKTECMAIVKPPPSIVSEEELSIYGTEGLFVIPGKSYIIDFLNQNVYYKLTTVFETVDTIIRKSPINMKIESVLPMVVNDVEYPAETFANLMICDNNSVPDPTMELDIHLSDYHREHITMPLSQLKAHCRYLGCSFYFAYNGVREGEIRGMLFASNLPKGYNHLFSLRIDSDQLTASTPIVYGDVYLYIPPIDKSKLFGTAPTKKSGENFLLP